MKCNFVPLRARIVAVAQAIKPELFFEARKIIDDLCLYALSESQPISEEVQAAVRALMDSIPVDDPTPSNYFELQTFLDAPSGSAVGMSAFSRAVMTENIEKSQHLFGQLLSVLDAILLSVSVLGTKQKHDINTLLDRREIHRAP